MVKAAPAELIDPAGMRGAATSSRSMPAQKALPLAARRMAPILGITVGAFQCFHQVAAKFARQGVALFGAVEASRSTRPFWADSRTLLTVLRVGRQMDVVALELRRGFDYNPGGRSISIANSAAPKVLPWASVRSETVPPPPRARCSRKLSAPRLGSSKRSTGPSTSPAEVPLRRARR